MAQMKILQRARSLEHSLLRLQVRVGAVAPSAALVQRLLALVEETWRLEAAARIR